MKSLLSFGHRLGYLPFDVGRAVKQPRFKDTLAERILTEADVHHMLALEPGRWQRLAVAGSTRKYSRSSPLAVAHFRR